MTPPQRQEGDTSETEAEEEKADRSEDRIKQRIFLQTLQRGEREMILTSSRDP